VEKETPVQAEVLHPQEIAEVQLDLAGVVEAGIDIIVGDEGGAYC
jgi:hypothetical protein